MTSRIVSYLLSLNFKNSIDRERFTGMLIENGFKQKFEKNGFLVPEGKYAKKPLDDNMQKSIHAPKYSLIREYSSIYPFNEEFGTKISINYNFGTGTLSGNLKNTIQELNLIFEILKKKLHLLSTDINSCNLEVAISVKNRRNPQETLDSLNNLDIHILKDMELVKWNHDVYLYSKDLDVTKESVDVCIVEDMKKKNITPRNIPQKNRWNKIVLVPHPNEYTVVMSYFGDNIDGTMQIFAGIEDLASKIITEVEK